uniref:C-type lectin domain-containing protein n=1 Tax=Branchiostoma floridae TaxID=7739 RepID=C3YY69_BRAFL|eukprot:XP_002599016.1 hypothetical protein BRAFLDRAFT_79948 [Branchiostoma floridae]
MSASHSVQARASPLTTPVTSFVHVFPDVSVSQCPGQSIAFNHACYEFPGAELRNVEARQYCEGRNGTLAMPKTPAVDAYIVGIIQYSGYQAGYWIGIEDPGPVNAAPLWSDGTPVTSGCQYDAFAEGEPNFLKFRDRMPPQCAMIGSDFLWSTDTCDYEKRFICQYVPDCPTGYHKLKDTCYGAKQAVLNYIQAESACAQDGGTLAMPKHLQTDFFLIGLMIREAPDEDFWIGIEDRRWEYNHMFADGIMLADCAFIKWSSIAPRDRAHMMNCIMYWSSRGYFWHDMPCMERMSYVCQIGEWEWMFMATLCNCKKKPKVRWYRPLLRDTYDADSSTLYIFT